MKQTMIKIKTDLHCHTIASSHAYSTVAELACWAAKRELEAIAVTDHGTAIPDAPHPWHFENLGILPKEIDGVRILHGVEVNILDGQGAIDMEEDLLKKMDIVVASIHTPCYREAAGGDHTGAYLGALAHKDVDILGHSGDPRFVYDYEQVVRRAKENHQLIEINAHTFRGRQASVPNCRRIAQWCKKLEAGIVVNSDAHICYNVASFEPALEMLSEIDFPEKLIMNRDLTVLRDYLAPRKKIEE